jgi:6-phosphogluconolactonase
LDKHIEIFQSPQALAVKFAEELIRRINESAEKKKSVSVALSGGSTPDLLFSLLGDHFSGSANWEYVHFFWGDERCVPPDDPESNFGAAYKRFLGKIDIPAANIHRIKGEADPEKEAKRYSEEILSCTMERDGFPVFDLIMLGIGEDGHTASIFPGNMDLLYSAKICEVTCHPVTFQKRITVTCRVINNSESVVFLVTGKKKANIAENIIKKRPSSRNLPASFINPVYGELRWLVDKEAASLL